MSVLVPLCAKCLYGGGIQFSKNTVPGQNTLAKSPVFGPPNHTDHFSSWTTPEQGLQK